MRKLLGIVLGLALVGVVAAQVNYVNAKSSDDRSNDRDDKPLTSPLTSPCKPGWGYGDKNHCHTGPPGLTHNSSHSEEHGE